MIDMIIYIFIKECILLKQDNLCYNDKMTKKKCCVGLTLSLIVDKNRLDK